MNAVVLTEIAPPNRGAAETKVKGDTATAFQLVLDETQAEPDQMRHGAVPSITTAQGTDSSGATSGPEIKEPARSHSEPGTPERRISRRPRSDSEDAQLLDALPVQFGDREGFPRESRPDPVAEPIGRDEQETRFVSGTNPDLDNPDLATIHENAGTAARSSPYDPTALGLQPENGLNPPRRSAALASPVLPGAIGAAPLSPGAWHSDVGVSSTQGRAGLAERSPKPIAASAAQHSPTTLSGVPDASADKGAELRPTDTHLRRADTLARLAVTSETEGSRPTALPGAANGLVAGSGGELQMRDPDAPKPAAAGGVLPVLEGRLSGRESAMPMTPETEPQRGARKTEDHTVRIRKLSAAGHGVMADLKAMPVVTGGEMVVLNQEQPLRDRQVAFEPHRSRAETATAQLPQVKAIAAATSTPSPAVDAVAHFVDDMAAAETMIDGFPPLDMRAAASSLIDRPAAPVPLNLGQVALPDVLGQRLAQAATQITDGPVEVTLSPEELGRVRMTLVTHEGNLTMAILAERPETLDLLRRHIETLAQDFRDLGFDDLNFSFSDRPDPQAPWSAINVPAEDAETALPSEAAMLTPAATRPNRALHPADSGLDLRL